MAGMGYICASTSQGSNLNCRSQSVFYVLRASVAFELRLTLDFEGEVGRRGGEAEQLGVRRLRQGEAVDAEELVADAEALRGRGAARLHAGHEEAGAELAAAAHGEAEAVRRPPAQAERPHPGPGAPRRRRSRPRRRLVAAAQHKHKSEKSHRNAGLFNP